MFDELIDQMLAEAKRLEAQLNETYDVTSFNLEISTKHEMFRYAVSCRDSINGFQAGYGITLLNAMLELESGLTPKANIAGMKREQAEKLLSEAAGY